MSFSFSSLDDTRVEEAFTVLRSVGQWLDSQGRRQRISKTTFETYQQWQSESANYIVTEDDKIIGLVTLRRESLIDWPAYADLGRVLMLRGLATHPDHRNQGIGAFAVRQAIQMCDETEDIYLDCVSDFLPDYYGNLGFEKIDQQLHCYPDDDSFDITLMRYCHDVRSTGLAEK